MKKFTGVIEGINFKTGSANILPGSFTILDRAVQVLKEYPDLKLEIQGHTDNRGRADLQPRPVAAAGRRGADLLHHRGASPPSALTAIGYGLDRPIADNQSESGRSRNRRTEFQLVSRQ